MRRISLSPLAVRIIQLALVVAFIAAWEFGASTGRLDKFFYSQPSKVLAQISDWVASGKLWRHVAVTLSEMLAGFAIGTAVGIVLGFLLGRSQSLGSLLLER